MPLSKNTLVRSAALAILVGLAALLSIVGTTLWLVGRTQTTSEQLFTARQQRSAIVDLRSLLQDAETGQRGYLLTRSDAYLAPYDNARAKVRLQVAKLGQLVQGDTGQATLAGELGGIVDAKLDELDRTVALVKAGKPDEALAIVATNRGRYAMDQARAVLGTMVANAEQAVSAKLDEQQGSIQALRWVTIIGALCIIAAAGAMVWMISVYTRQLMRAQRDIEGLNAGLEERVAERTADLSRANEEIQRFAYIVTHDLRAPLVNIMGFTSELETSLAPVRSFVEGASAQDAGAVPEDAKLAVTEDLPEAIGFIRSSTRKMDGLINAILKLSREGRRVLKAERVDLDAFLRTAADSVQHQLVEAGGEIVMAGRAPPITSDRLSLEQIFGNLLDNAVKYRAPNRAPRIELTTGAEAGGRHRGQDRRTMVGGSRRRTTNASSTCSGDPGCRTSPARASASPMSAPWCAVWAATSRSTSEFGRGTTFTVTLPQDIRKATGSA